MKQEEVLKLFEETGALLNGHFELRSFDRNLNLSIALGGYLANDPNHVGVLVELFGGVADSVEPPFHRDDPEQTSPNPNRHLVARREGGHSVSNEACQPEERQK